MGKLCIYEVLQKMTAKKSDTLSNSQTKAFKGSSIFSSGTKVTRSMKHVIFGGYKQSTKKVVDTIF